MHNLESPSLADFSPVISVTTASPARTPLTFKPILMERIWGGQKLADLFGKQLPAGKLIGESWEMVDRPEAQSIVRGDALAGKTLHELWKQHRKEIFGDLPGTPRFPLLVKLLDARERLSLQVHPPEKVATKLGGETKTEFWYVAAAEPDAEIFVGLREAMTAGDFEEAVRSGRVAKHVHTIPVKAGNAMFLPAGRFHGIGGGNVLIEVQQNSDTTYRVFDWNRVDPTTRRPRELHVEQALQCIDFNDVRPKLIEPMGDLLVKHELFEIQKWNLDSPREIAPAGQFAIVCCLSGTLRCADVDLAPGEFCLIPAQLEDRRLKPLSEKTSLLRITIPT